MINLSKIIYKATGIMSKKQIMKTCGKIGDEVSENLLNGNRVKAQTVQEILAKNIGAKKAGKVQITDDLDSFKDFARKELNLQDDVSELIFYNSKSAVIPGPKTNRSLLNLRTDSMEAAETVNLTTHELEHVLNQRLGFRASIEKLYVKLRGKKFIENYTKKYGDLLNKKNIDMQAHLLIKSKLGTSATHGFTSYGAGIDGLLKQTGLKSKEELHKMITKIIREQILLPDCDKRNLKILNAVKVILKDESRAYKAGGTAERNFLTRNILKDQSSGGQVSISENITKAEMLSQLYDEAVTVLKKEIKKQKVNRIKQFIGLKPKDYHQKPEQSPINFSKRDYEEVEVMIDEIPKHIKDGLK